MLCIFIWKKNPSFNPSPIGNSPYNSHADCAEWLKYQEVNQRLQYQRKLRVVSSMIPIRPFHSISIDLSDKSNQSFLVIKKSLFQKTYHYIFVIVDHLSRYMYCFPLEIKQPRTLTSAFVEFYDDIFVRFPILNQLHEHTNQSVFVIWIMVESSSVSLKRNWKI
jgi:hypothetical protein